MHAQAQTHETPTTSSKAPPRAERMSFAEFCEDIGMNRVLRRGFEAHMSGEGVTAFNPRLKAEWERLRSEFLQKDRRRRR